MIAIIATAHREGTGAYAVLDYLLHAWRRPVEELVIITPRDSRAADAAQHRGFPLLYLNTARDALRLNFFAARRHLRALRGCDRVHAWHSRGFELAAYLGRRLGASVTATLHDPPHAPAHGQMRRWLMRTLAPRCDRLAAVSECLRDEWKPYVNPDRVSVIHNGVTDIPLPARETRNIPVVGFLGMYVGWKGFSILSEWIRSFEGESCRFNLYGEVSSDLRPQLDRLLAGAGARVMYRGRQERGIIFSEIDVLVNPSTAFDPLPTTLIEAAQAGIPVVASSLGGACEIVVAGETGCIYDARRPEEGADILRTMVRDPKRRRELGERARHHWLECFTPARMAQGYETFWGLS